MISREMFEEWFCERRPISQKYMNWRESMNSYDYNIVQVAWEAWQASRNVEIDLPKRIDNIELRSPLEVEDMWRDRMGGAIRAAGFKVKGG